jgi:hypothetical protein
MEHNFSWGADSSAANQVRYLLYNPEVHYRIYSTPLLVSVESDNQATPALFH